LETTNRNPRAPAASSPPATNATPVSADTASGQQLASQFAANAIQAVNALLPKVGDWLLSGVSKAASMAGMIIGLALIPVFTFWFLLQEDPIKKGWTKYLPVQESRFKDELVFVISAINDYLIVFFRGQVLVAICDGILLTVGFLALGLNYALLLGVMYSVLAIVPYLGTVLTIIPAFILAAVQFNDWLHPLLVLAVFAAIMMIEGVFLSPKIMGNRVGLHPLTIMIALLVGVTLFGGILGGVLAIPLTAALRVIMTRYVWKKPETHIIVAAGG
jgi:predicted PurR-regulated permease PerM